MMRHKVRSVRVKKRSKKRSFEKDSKRRRGSHRIAFRLIFFFSSRRISVFAARKRDSALISCPRGARWSNHRLLLLTTNSTWLATTLLRAASRLRVFHRLAVPDSIPHRHHHDHHHHDGLLGVKGGQSRGPNPRRHRQAAAARQEAPCPHREDPAAG